MGKVLNEKVFTKLVRLKKAKHDNKIKTGAIQYDDSHYLFTDGIIVAKVKEKTLTEKMKTVSDFNEEQLRQVEKIFRDYEEKKLDEEELELV
jgi:inorganic pyrophosphatase